MASLSSNPITQSDLIEFLDSTSDFGFELEILKMLVEKEFACEHGGTYTDPVTNKPREFDIRAGKKLKRHQYLRLAVECKNLRENYPLLITCLPRRNHEAVHDVVFSVNQSDALRYIKPNQMIAPQTSIRFPVENNSIYPENAPVGKSCDQVGRKPSAKDGTLGELAGGNSEIYNKWSQALSSAHDLISIGHSECGRNSTQKLAFTIVLPLLVIPDNRLWVTQYDYDGNRIAEPVQTDRCSFYVNHEYSERSGMHWDLYSMSHLEIVMTTGLKVLIDDFLSQKDKWDDYFGVDIPKRMFESRS